MATAGVTRPSPQPKIKSAQPQMESAYRPVGTYSVTQDPAGGGGGGQAGGDNTDAPLATAPAGPEAGGMGMIQAQPVGPTTAAAPVPEAATVAALAAVVDGAVATGAAAAAAAAEAAAAAVVTDG